MTRPARPTQADVAKLAGVSVATVSYVLSGRASRNKPASPETVAKVQEAITELGYRPQLMARALRRQRTGLVAVLTYTPLNPWVDDLLAQTQTKCSVRGMETILLPFTDTVHLHRQARLMRAGLVDAVLVLGLEDMRDDVRRSLADLPVPVLAVANEGPEGISLIRQHEQSAITGLLDHLRGAGVERLHYVAEPMPEWKASTARRTQWLLDAAADVGFPAPELHAFDQRSPSGEDARALFGAAGRDGRGAIVCSSDRAAISLLWCAVRDGISVPAEVRITGMGNIDEGNSTAPRLTTLGARQTDYSEAIDGLLDRIDDPGLSPRAHDLNWHLIKRDSG